MPLYFFSKRKGFSKLIALVLFLPYLMGGFIHLFKCLKSGYFQVIRNLLVWRVISNALQPMSNSVFFCTEKLYTTFTTTHLVLHLHLLVVLIHPSDS